MKYLTTGKKVNTLNESNYNYNLVNNVHLNPTERRNTLCCKQTLNIWLKRLANKFMMLTLVTFLFSFNLKSDVTNNVFKFRKLRSFSSFRRLCGRLKVSEK